MCVNCGLTHLFLSVPPAPHNLRQPAKEEKAEESPEKSPGEAEVATEGEGAEEQKKEQEGEGKGEEEGGEAQTSIFQSPLRLVRKTKMKLIMCRVTLLDGTDFTCEVEVSILTKTDAM